MNTAEVLLVLVILAIGQSVDQDTPRAPGTDARTSSQQQSANETTAALQNQPSPAQDTSRASQNPAQQDSYFEQKAVAWSAIIQAVSALFVMGFTAALVIYSHKGWKVAAKAADAAKDSAVVALAQLRVLERPRLRVQSVGITHLTPADGRSAPRAEAQIVNTGESPAVNLYGGLRWVVWKELPSRNPIPRLQIVSGKISDRVEPSRWFFMETVRHEWPEEADPDLVFQAGGDDYVLGYLHFGAENGRRGGFIAFCRKLNRETGRFDPVGNPEYEYEA